MDLNVGHCKHVTHDAVVYFKSKHKTAMLRKFYDNPANPAPSGADSRTSTPAMSLSVASSVKGFAKKTKAASKFVDKRLMATEETGPPVYMGGNPWAIYDKKTRRPPVKSSMRILGRTSKVKLDKSQEYKFNWANDLFRAYDFDHSELITVDEFTPLIRQVEACFILTLTLNNPAGTPPK